MYQRIYYKSSVDDTIKNKIVVRIQTILHNLQNHLPVHLVFITESTFVAI